MKNWGRILIGSGITASLVGSGYLLWRRRQQVKRHNLLQDFDYDG